MSSIIVQHYVTNCCNSNLITDIDIAYNYPNHSIQTSTCDVSFALLWCAWASQATRYFPVYYIRICLHNLPRRWHGDKQGIANSSRWCLVPISIWLDLCCIFGGCEDTSMYDEICWSQWRILERFVKRPEYFPYACNKLLKIIQSFDVYMRYPRATFSLRAIVYID